MKKGAFLILFLFLTKSILATPSSNEWSSGWPYPSNPGLMTITEYAVPNQNNLKPLATNILIQHFSIYNSIAGTNNFPYLTSIRLDQIGTASDSDIVDVHLYYDQDGTWNGNELEFLSTTTNNYNLGTTFSKDYSPTQFENNIANFGYIQTDEMGLHLPWSNTYHFYITIDMSQNVVDKVTIDTRIPNIKMFMKCQGGYWEQNMAVVDTPINAVINVTATNLIIFGEPPAPGIDVDTDFSLSVKAVDQYGNIDKDYTGSIYFSSSDPNAVLPYTAASPYTFTAGDAGVRTFSNFKLLSGPQENITVSDGAGGLNDDVSANIIVIADVDHYRLLADGTNRLKATNITAGETLDNLGITNITAIAYNYLSSIIPDYTGSVYFYSSANGTYDSFPASINNKYIYTGAGGDDGTHNFPANQFKLTKAGKQNLIITDGVHTGEWLNITVQAGNYTKLMITCDTNVIASSYFPMTIQATDPYDNIITGVSTSLKMSITRINNVSDSAVNADYPQENLQLSSGGVSISGQNSIRINEGGSFRITITDLNNSSITATHDVSTTLSLPRSKNSSVTYNYIRRAQSQSMDIYYNNTTTSPVTVEVEIYSVSGKLVKKFDDQTADFGINRLKSWDAKNDNNEKVVSGVYLTVIKANGVSEKHHVIVVR